MYGPESGGLFRPNVDFRSLSFLFFGIASVAFHANFRYTLEPAAKLALFGFISSMSLEILTLRNSRKTREYDNFVACLVWIGLLYISPTKLVQVTLSAFLLLPSVWQLFKCYVWKRPYPFGQSQDRVIRAWRATSLFVLACLFRTLDTELCTMLGDFRRSVGQPWAGLFELHAWWHILSAFAASEFMSLLRESRYEAGIEKEQEQTEERKAEIARQEDYATFPLASMFR